MFPPFYSEVGQTLSRKDAAGAWFSSEVQNLTNPNSKEGRKGERKEGRKDIKKKGRKERGRRNKQTQQKITGKDVHRLRVKG